MWKRWSWQVFPLYLLVCSYRNSLFLVGGCGLGRMLNSVPQHLLAPHSTLWGTSGPGKLIFRPCLHMKNNGLKDPKFGLFWHTSPWEEVVALKGLCWGWVAASGISPCWTTPLVSWWSGGILVLVLRKLQVFLASAHFLLHASILGLDIMGPVLAWVAGCGHPVTSSVQVKRGGMSWSLGSFLAELVKVSPLNRESKHGGYSLLSISTSSLSLPVFSNKELKELATSLSAWPKHVEDRPFGMSEVRSSPSSVAACCSLCLTKARATIVEVIASPY